MNVLFDDAAIQLGVEIRLKGDVNCGDASAPFNCFGVTTKNYARDVSFTLRGDGDDTLENALHHFFRRPTLLALAIDTISYVHKYDDMKMFLKDVAIEIDVDVKLTGTIQSNGTIKPFNCLGIGPEQKKYTRKITLPYVVSEDKGLGDFLYEFFREPMDMILAIDTIIRSVEKDNRVESEASL